MGKKLLMILAFVLLLWDRAPALRAQSALPPLTHAQEVLIRKIEGRLMAPCCYTQTIRDHDSQVAVDMRNEVTAFVASGKSEEVIVTYYRTKYGETILVVPDGITGRIAYGIPVVVFLASLGLLLLMIRRSVRARKRTATPALPNRPDNEKRAFLDRIRADIGEI